MKRQLEKLLAELRRLKSEGVERVAVSEESLHVLRESVARIAPAAAPADGESGKTPATSAPRGDRRRTAPSAAAAARPPQAPPGTSPEPATKKAEPSFPPAPTISLPDGDKQTRWDALRRQVLECPVCNEHVRHGCKVVFGVGNIDADIFFVGEAPGAEEEVQGEPFVGPAGQLLTRMIKAMGLERADVYIGNIMNWRPDTRGRSGNRPPTAEEMAYCLPYLLAQIEIVQPKAIVALGATAVAGLFGADDNRRMRDVRGKWLDFNGTPAMVTYHPSYLLHRDVRSVKRTVWEDLLQVMEKVGLPISAKQRNFFLKG